MIRYHHDVKDIKSDPNDARIRAVLDVEPSPLSPELTLAANYSAHLEDKLRRDRAELINRSHREGSPITGEKITGLDARYNTELSIAQDQSLHDMILRAATKEQKANPGAATRAIDAVKDIPVVGALAASPAIGGMAKTFELFRAYDHVESEYYYAWGKADDALEIKRNADTTLDADRLQQKANENFLKHYVAKADHKKNLDVPRDVATVPELVSVLLKNNPGIAIGDIHVEQEPPQLLVELMPQLKRDGVDTIYLEQSPKDVAKLNALSRDELNLLLEERAVPDKDVYAHTQESLAEVWQKPSVDDVEKQWIRLHQAARDHGIRLVGMDSEGLVGGKDRVLRIALTNPVWTDYIKNDRKILANEGRHGGKYVVIGGLGHFDNEMVGNWHGLVDEALGIPVLSFDRTHDGAPAFVKPLNGAADFYLAANPYYKPISLERMYEKEKALIKALDKQVEKIDSTPLSSRFKQALNAWEEMNSKKIARLHLTYYDQQLPENIGQQSVLPSAPAARYPSDGKAR
ncbi:MAG: hypothetical protein SFW63_06105 [Alphaproteobacteria bacterium]|nr:hypothetical protein [Alphaproteobacteria bacterium]